MIPAQLPEFITTREIAAFLHVGEPAASRIVRRGDLGPFARVGRRYVLRRESVIASLRAREVEAEPRPVTGVVPATAPAWAAAVLQRRRGGA